LAVARRARDPLEDGMVQPGRTALCTRALSKDFRGLVAVDNVDIEVREGSVHALVGPNGAGKTTLFNLLTGFLRPSSGEILLGDRVVTGLPPERVVQLGVARSFQITSLFAQMSAREHVELALQGRTREGWRFWRSARLLDRHREQALDLLDQVGLAGSADAKAGSLTYGEKRALELALTLALEPRLLLLDEPTAGMGLEDVERTVALVRRVREGRTVVLVEHNMRVVADLADRVTVLQQGAVLVEGPYDEVREDPRVISAYLGKDAHGKDAHGKDAHGKDAHGKDAQGADEPAGGRAEGRDA
jgi:branched-chain amino acid transport system ATP-binding protein